MDQQNPWVCPLCRTPLRAGHDELSCDGCAAEYDLVAGIPDLRVLRQSSEEIERERAHALELRERATRMSSEALVYSVFSSRTTWTERDARSHTRMILDGIDRLQRDLDGWLAPCVQGDGPVLDLGCGAGQLLVALGHAGRSGIGIDESLGWLVVAHALLQDRGMTPMIAAAQAEALPLRSESVASVVSLDVIEHVIDPVPYLEEMERVLARDGAIALSTPNRFSLAAKPHVAVWGVGWLPRRVQKPYAEWRGTKPYDRVRLLSYWELKGIVRRSTGLEPRILVPPIPRKDMERFPTYRRWLGRIYNALITWPVARAFIKPVAPFYRIIARRDWN